MHADLAEKLRLTAAALGCATRKDLCAWFRRVNPQTRVDLDRLGKWMQGRAAPRDGSVYQDWARLIDTGHSAAWVRSCSPEAFRTELVITLGVDVAALAGDLAEGRAERPGAHLAGAYACYSPAWSPYFAGRILRGSMIVAPGHRQAMSAVYAETLLGATVRFRGEVLLSAGCLHLPLREEASGLPLFLSLFLPGRPASALCGMMAGSTLVGPEQRPSSCRIVAVRVPREAPLLGTDRYLEPDEGIGADLAALGLPPAAARAAAELAERLLTEAGSAAFSLIPLASQSSLEATLDPLWLGGAPARSVSRVREAGASTA
jgi:hypothetical protein